MEEQESLKDGLKKKKTKILYQNKSCTVTDRQFKTRRKTYKISKIEKTEIRRSFLIFFPICFMALVFTFKFVDYIYMGEFLYLFLGSVIGGLFSIFFGTLFIHSKALGEPALFGFIPSLNKVRAKLDDSMLELEDRNDKDDGYMDD